MGGLSTAYQHGIGLAKALDGSRYFVFGKHLVWNGRVRPQASSRPYTLQIDHTFERGLGLPKVRVVAPRLKLAVGMKKLPHVYSPGDILCLFQPAYKEWTEQEMMSETILPWAVEWLCFYEMWLVTGEWLGGGEHPI